MSTPDYLSALISQHQPVETHQALLIIGLQDDFISPDGKLPVDTSSGFVDRILELVPKFRELAGDIIWVRTTSSTNRSVNDNLDDRNTVLTDTGEGAAKDAGTPEHAPPQFKNRSKSKSRSSKSRKRVIELFKSGSSSRTPDARAEPPTEGSSSVSEDDELFLSTSTKQGLCVIPSSKGADFPNSVKSVVDPSADILVNTSHYSAFKSTQLLMTLQMKRITELYICGCMTNISVYATTRAAASGFSVRIVEDCLGYRTKSRHDLAMKHITEGIGAHIITSRDMLEQLDEPDEEDDEDDLLQATMSKMTIQGDSAKERAAQTKQEYALATIEQSLAQIAMSSDAARPKTSGGKATARAETSTESRGPKQSASAATGLRTRASMPDVGKGLVKSKPRMRRRVPTIEEGVGPDKTVRKRHSEAEMATQHIVRPTSMTKIGDAKPAVHGEGRPTVVERDSRSVATQLQPVASEAPAASKSKTTRKQSPSKNRIGSTDKTTSNEQKESSRAGPSREAPAPAPSPATAQGPQDLKSKKPSSQTATTMSIKKLPSLANLPTLGPGDRIGEGDSNIEYDLIPSHQRDLINPNVPLSSTIFHGLYHEVAWQKMYHAAGEVPRLVAVQGAIRRDGSKPIYRHPSDQSPPLLPFSAKVKLVKEAAEEVVGHPLNHVLIQLYRDGKDYISEHSDKTLDIVRGSKIVNASFGARRTMRLRRKKRKGKSQADEGEQEDGKTAVSEVPEPREAQRIPLPHNSLFVLGLKTNQAWLHGINADKRAAADRSPEELACEGMRISLTFRHIGTFLSSDEKKIWGQGAKNKNKEDAADVVNGDEKETERMIRAFGKENQEDESWDWEQSYGEGFDVLHFRAD